MQKGSSGAAGQGSRATGGARKRRRQWRLRAKAIRSVWVVARYLGLADPSPRCRMSTDDALREAMVRSWLAGYRRAQADAKTAQARFMASKASFGGGL